MILKVELMTARGWDDKQQTQEQGQGEKTLSGVKGYGSSKATPSEVLSPARRHHLSKHHQRWSGIQLCEPMRDIAQMLTHP